MRPAHPGADRQPDRQADPPEYRAGVAGPGPANANAFDAVVAFDGGADDILQYGGVKPEDVAALVQGAIFTRGTQDLSNTAIFVGGGDVPAAQKVFAEFGTTPAMLDDAAARQEFQAKTKSAPLSELAARLEISVPSLQDMLEALAQPDHDPREELQP